MIFLMFGEVLLHFSTSGILGLFAVFGFEVNKASTNSRLKNHSGHRSKESILELENSLF